jgi:EAL domain-containing protein (putative c-di-GMP-specific phosphodiesterase class I)
MNVVKTALDRFLEPGGLSVVFQPIVDLLDSSRRTAAYESLTRGPAGTNFATADVLFEYVRRKRAELVIDRACISLGLTQGSRLPHFPLIHLNVHATTLAHDSDFPKFLQETALQSGVKLEKIVVEIVEHSPASDDKKFHASLRAIRGLGATIGLDDVGLGQSNYKMILDIAPECLKIDRYFVSGCAEDRRRRVVLKSITELGREFGASVVAEGIENEEDLAVVKDFGVRYGQGYLFGKPMPVEAFKS